ncbi:MAG: terminase small subunit [Betaproteobacteria bacterium]|nr:MAG: terminase small subunit [Bacteroidota bacterium]TDI83203.1 MAG: terminase small subunit [Betaproteobacteria bacterium]
MPKLTAKQEMFCREYLIDLNAKQAAIRAGYKENSAKEQGCENLTKPNIQEYIQELKKPREEKLGIDAEWVLKRALRINDKSLEEDDNGECSNLAAANKSLELIGKHISVDCFNNNLKVSADIKLTDMSDEDLDAELASLDN